MINKVFLIGRAGKDASVNTTDRGAKVLKFTLATWVHVKDETHETGWRTITEWHNIVSWTDQADSIAAKIKTGSMVTVDGSVRTREYEKEGVKKQITEIVGAVKAIPIPKSEPKAKTVTPAPLEDKQEMYVDPESGLPF